MFQVLNKKTRNNSSWQAWFPQQQQSARHLLFHPCFVLKLDCTRSKYRCRDVSGTVQQINLFSFNGQFSYYLPSRYILYVVFVEICDRQANKKKSYPAKYQYLHGMFVLRSHSTNCTYLLSITNINLLFNTVANKQQKYSEYSYSAVLYSLLHKNSMLE